MLQLSYYAIALLVILAVLQIVAILRHGLYPRIGDYLPLRRNTGTLCGACGSDKPTETDWMNNFLNELDAA
jgi:hypothetical protein